jgi:hypothetical protein
MRSNAEVTPESAFLEIHGKSRTQLSRACDCVGDSSSVEVFSAVVLSVAGVTDASLEQLKVVLGGL